MHKRATVEGCGYTLEGLVDVNADLDGVFELVEDDGTVLRVKGWLMEDFSWDDQAQAA